MGEASKSHAPERLHGAGNTAEHGREREEEEGKGKCSASVSGQQRFVRDHPEHGSTRETENPNEYVR